MNRYGSQMHLPEIGSAGQKHLRESRVLVVGAGGLGATLLPLLAGAGVGTIRLYDGDRVEENNLHRQTLYRMDDVGSLKVDCAFRTLRALNEDCILTPVAELLGPENIARALEGTDLAIDAADSVAATYMLSDACRQRHLPLISASALGLKGYVGGFCGTAPSYRALFPEVPSQTGNCNTLGVMGPVVATMGTIEAQMALSVLLALSPSPLGYLMAIDFATWHTSEFRFDRAPEPDAFAPFIGVADLQPNDCVVDLRSMEEAPQSVIRDALRILPDEIAAWTAPENRRLVMVCASGLRAMRAASALGARGYTTLAVLAAGHSPPAG